jgi:thiamine-phosphate pyrophosphorylase
LPLLAARFTSKPMHEHLQVILDVHDGADPRPLLSQVLRGGRPLVQLRAKTLGDRAFFEVAMDVVRTCHENNVRCIIDDRIDIALAVEADGVHVGESDIPVVQARRLLGADAVVGATARTIASAVQRQAEGATYIGCGTVFLSTTKTGLPDPLGISHVGSVTLSVTIPVFAIGGVTVDSARRLREVGCHGVAVVSAIAEANDPALETTRFMSVVTPKAVVT